MNFKTATSLISDILGLPEPQLEAEETYSIVVDEDTAVTFSFRKNRFVMQATLEPPLPSNDETLARLKSILAFHLHSMQTTDDVLSVHPDTKNLVLSRYMEPADLTVDALQNNLNAFLDTASMISKFLKNPQENLESGPNPMFLINLR